LEEKFQLSEGIMAEREVMLGLSLEEKERRYSLLRRKLAEADLVALIVYGGSQLGVPVHYLTKVWGSKFNMLIFPIEGDPIFLTASNSIATPTSISQQGCWIPIDNIRLSANLSVDAAKVITDLKLNDKRIGIDSYRFWPVFEYQQFKEKCPKVELVEAHRLFGEVRGTKSEEELIEIEKAIKISDLAHYTFLANKKLLGMETGYYKGKGRWVEMLARTA
jgi:Xaa-Pro aminopeptidase